MKVLAWVPEPLDVNPGQRYRIEQWDPYLRRQGVEIAYSPFSSASVAALMKSPGHVGAKARGVLTALWRRLREASSVSECDLVYVFREGALLGPALAERALARRLPFVFDFDDAVWVRYVSPANSYLSYLRFPGKTATLCRLARHVMAGNPYLRDYAARYNERVTIVPTTIDTARYEVRPRRVNAVPVIGWTGSYSTEQYLRLVRTVLERLRKRREFRFAVVGGRGFAVDGVEVEHRPWRSATEVDDLRDFDIGIMPLPDTEWERGKCGLKALQYMALEIPAVASPVGVNRDIIQHGTNGLLASTEEEWAAALERLLSDASLRRALGRAGRATVEAGYSAAVQAPRVAEIFRSAVRTPAPAA
jgi:glycosyltransferase involved in cell wall biosynthesis